MRSRNWFVSTPDWIILVISFIHLCHSLIFHTLKTKIAVRFGDRNVRAARLQNVTEIFHLMVKPLHCHHRLHGCWMRLFLSSCRFHSQFQHGLCCQRGSASSSSPHSGLCRAPRSFTLCGTQHTPHPLTHFPLFLAVFDQLDLVTYEEVVKLPAFKRKTLVLLGELCRWSAGHRDVCCHE